MRGVYWTEIFLPCLLKWMEELVLGGGWVEGVPSTRKKSIINYLPLIINNDFVQNLIILVLSYLS